MKIGFTGPRKGMTIPQKYRLADILNNMGQDGVSIDEFHHGDCRGSDEEAFEIAEHLGWATIAHPSTLKRWNAYTKSDLIMPPQPPLYRNKIIVETVNLLVATPCTPEILRSGTWSTVRYARKQERSIWIIHRDGTEEREDW